MKKLTRTQALEKLREVSEGMRRLNPEAFDAAQASVRRNMAAALQHQPQLFEPAPKAKVIALSSHQDRTP